MKIIRIVIERSKDCYWAYAENLDGVSGGGDTVEEAKKEVLNSLELQKELGNIANRQYEIRYKYDTESLLQYYKGILNNPAMERITGINQKLIHQYSTGKKKPRIAQRQKITEALHRLGREMLAIEL